VNVGLKTQILPAGEAAVAAAARILAEGGLVAFPTETVYGLGADATNPAAIARLYQAKGRPAFNPLIAHVGDIAAARKIARFDAPAIALAEAFWPGPLTLVLPTSPLPASTRLRSGYRPTLWRATFCELSAAPW
jgi:L-threonylcarbamoyladenylate synthase